MYKCTLDGGATQKGPGYTWRYPNSDVTVSMLTLGAEALGGIDSNARTLKGELAEALGVVFVDSDGSRVVPEISGKALLLVFKRQLVRCDWLRSDFGENGLLATRYMLLRIGLAVNKRAPGALLLPGIEKAAGFLDRSLSGPCIRLRARHARR